MIAIGDIHVLARLLWTVIIAMQLTSVECLVQHVQQLKTVCALMDNQHVKIYVMMDGMMIIMVGQMLKTITAIMAAVMEI